LAAALVCAEAIGPVVFAGWDADGEPVGRPWPTPWIQITAANEDQTANVWRALLPMIRQGPLYDEIPDAGETRINVPGGGLIEPVTASFGARLGQRITCAVQDETHSWKPNNGGVKLADTQRRNLSGTGGRAIETTNAWDPADRSTAQLTEEAKQDDVHRDHVLAPASLSFSNKSERRKILRIVYGDSNISRGGWVDLDRIDAEAAELMTRDPQQAEQFYGNRPTPGAKQFIAADVWAGLARDLALVDGDDIALGFDGSINEDSTALVACRISDGLLVPVHIWNKPAGEDGIDWEVDPDEVGQLVDDCFRRFRVALMYADPHEWRSEVGKWSTKHGDGKHERVREFPTNSLTRIGPAVGQFRSDAMRATLIHNGDRVLAEHIANARTSKRGNWTVITKETEKSPKKMDGAMGAVIAYQARNDAIELGLVGRRTYYAYTA